MENKNPLSPHIQIYGWNISLLVSLIESSILDILQRISSVVSTLSLSYQIIIYLRSIVSDLINALLQYPLYSVHDTQPHDALVSSNR